ncbi:MAG: hypothetical protein LIP12_10035 [Clostridiales bacterium]|nr:hypothetical protein [Clostridiales bacterium]
MYKNFGDYHFFEHGRLVDDEHSDTEIKVLYCEPYPDVEDLYQFAELTVDITDSWINKKNVCDYASLDVDDLDPVQFALAAISYYGAENFGAMDSMVQYDWQHMSRENILDILKYRMIANDNISFETVW